MTRIDKSTQIRFSDLFGYGVKDGFPDDLTLNDDCDEYYERKII